MTYAASESSVAAGKPVGLIDLACGSSTWRYTSAATNLVYGGNTYLHQPGMTIAEVEYGRNVMQSVLEVEVPWSCPFVKLYPGAIPDGRVSCLWTRGHDPDYQIEWRGYVANVNRRENRRAVIQCTRSCANLGNTGLCLRPGKLCGVPLYHALCGVVKASYTFAGVIESVNGCDVVSPTFATQPDGYWRGGEFTALGITRMVITHTGDTVTLTHTIPGLAANQAFTATAGCDHTHTTCDTVFGNLLSQKAYRFMANRNPFIEGVL